MHKNSLKKKKQNQIFNKLKKTRTVLTNTQLMHAEIHLCVRHVPRNSSSQRVISPLGKIKLGAF